jgi:hypothetical protein
MHVEKEIDALLTAGLEYRLSEGIVLLEPDDTVAQTLERPPEVTLRAIRGDVVTEDAYGQLTRMFQYTNGRPNR